MTCPACGQPASTFHRFGFSVQGVSFRQSVKGYLRCQHCNALLRLVHYSRFVWLLIVLAVAFVALYTAFSRELLALVGIKMAQIALILSLFVVGYVGTYIFWRKAHVEMGDEKS